MTRQQESHTEVHDGMRIEWDVPITMDDGTVLRCDVFRPNDEGKYPVIMGATPYGKLLSFDSKVWGGQWRMLCAHEPEILKLSSNRFQNYEFPDPERFVPDGYILVRLDVRGTGRSPGFMDLLSTRETLDYYQCIEWAAAQPWSSGKVGLSGVSYLASQKWLNFHCLEHWTEYYTREGIALQKRFLSHFLKGEDTVGVRNRVS